MNAEQIELAIKAADALQRRLVEAVTAIKIVGMPIRGDMYLDRADTAFEALAAAMGRETSASDHERQAAE